MKKKSALYVVYFLGVILLVVLCLIFVRANEKDYVNKTIKAGASSGLTLKINCPKEIEMVAGSSVKLLDGFISVQPESAKLTHTIETDGNSKGIECKNNIITAKEIGNYDLIFSAKSGENTVVGTVKIKVAKQGESIDINKIRGSVTMGKSLDVTELFNIVNKVNLMKFENLVNIRYSNGEFTPTAVGLASVDAVFIYDFLEIRHHFTFEVKDYPQYRMEILYPTTDTVYVRCEIGDIFTIQYQIFNRDYDDVDQIVDVSIENAKVAEKFRNSSPFVKILCKAKGETKVTLVYLIDTTIRKTITIVFE